MIPSPGTEYYPMIDKAYRSSQLLTNQIFLASLEILQNKLAERARQTVGGACECASAAICACRPMRKAACLSPVCAAALLCLDPGLAFYVCAPELIAHSHAGLTGGGGKCIQLVLLFATAIAISMS